MFPFGMYLYQLFLLGFYPLVTSPFPPMGGSGPLLVKGNGQQGQYREDGNVLDHEIPIY
jgi:hypothetical protein